MARKESESSDSGSDSSSGSETEPTTIASDQVVTFYKKAAEVVNEVLKVRVLFSRLENNTERRPEFDIYQCSYALYVLQSEVCV